MSSRRQQVLDILKSLNPFSLDGGESGKALDSFDFADWQVVHGVLRPWLERRPGVGGKLFGFEAVYLPGETRVSIISPAGTVYATISNC